MKRVLLVLSFLLLCAPVHGFNLWKDILQETEFHKLDNFQPSTFLQIKKGEEPTFLAGVLTELISYRFLGGSVGTVTSLESGSKWVPAMQFGLKTEYFLSQLTKQIPDSYAFLNHLSIGPYVARDWGNGVWSYGVAANAKFNFSKEQTTANAPKSTASLPMVSKLNLLASTREW